MHGSAFDSLTRQITTRLSRRTSVGRLAALGVLGLLGLRAPQESTAKGKHRKRKHKKACPPCKQRKNGKCKGTQPDGTACTLTGGGAGICQSGSCLAPTPPQRVAPVPAPPAPPPPPPSPGCPAGTTACAGACVDTTADPTNCGTCGTRCGVNESCIDGICACSSGPNGPFVCQTGFSCCQNSATCICGGTKFADLTTCDAVATCPTNTIVCNGPTCKTCCPLESTCDTATGACVQ